MEEKNIFDILENTEQSVIDRLSEEFPPDDAEEKEKVFRMSQEKFNKANNTSKFTEADEQTVSGVDVVCKRPLWKKCLSMAAAAAILIGGAAGGFKAYKHFANTHTQNEAEKKIAPFGDFMETKYQICDYTSEPLFTLTQKSTATDDAGEDTDAPPINNVSIYGGTDIPEYKRQKLADFINSYDYKEVYTIDPEHPFPQQIMGNSAVGTDVFDILVNFFIPKQTGKNDPVAEAILHGEEPPKPQYENLTGLEKTVYSPFFIYIDGNRIKTITIDETYNVGGLTYTEFSYMEENGEYSVSDNDYLIKAYEIDYDLFKSTISDILGNEEEKTEPAPEDSNKFNPLSGFADKEYWIYNSYKGDINELRYVEVITEEGGFSYSASPRPALDAEKRRKLEDFFGNLTWKEGAAADTPDNPLADYDDTVSFDMLTDTEFSRIMLNLRNNTISVDTMAVEKQDGSDENFMTYICTDQASRSHKLYSTDYPDLKNKLKEILGDDFGSYNLFYDMDWECMSDESYEPIMLTKEDKVYFFNLITKHEWPCETDLTSQIPETVHLYCQKYNERFYFNVESGPNGTNVICFVIDADQNDENGAPMIKSSKSWQCDDASLAKQISEHILNAHPDALKDVPVDFSVIDSIEWDEKGLDFFIMSGSSWNPPDPQSIVLTEDKMKKLQECFRKHSWKMNAKNFSINTGDHVSIYGDYSDYIINLQVFFNNDGNVLLNFETNATVYENGRKLMDHVENGAFEFENRNYLCSDKNVFAEIMKIITE